MGMIYSAGQTLKIPANQMVNKIGKYLKKSIDSCYKYRITGNMNDVFCKVYYQKKLELRENPEDAQVLEKPIDINITTYQNKVRVNIIELDPKEFTVGYDLYTPDQLQDVVQARNLILHRILVRMEKRYKEYDFLFD